MPEPPPFVAAVLTGGASRRMGRDKATLEIDGVAMASRVCDAARRAGAAATACVGLAVPGEHDVVDDHPGEGPLGGLLTALRWAGGDVVVVLGCDLVSPSPPAIARAAALVAPPPPGGDHAGSGAPAGPWDVALPVARGRDQWLHAAWAPSALAPLAAAFAGGERSVHRAAAALRVLRYDEAEPLSDADEPGDLPPGAAGPPR